MTRGGKWARYPRGASVGLGEHGYFFRTSMRLHASTRTMRAGEEDEEACPGEVSPQEWPLPVLLLVKPSEIDLPCNGAHSL